MLDEQDVEKKIYSIKVSLLHFYDGFMIKKACFIYSTCNSSYEMWVNFGFEDLVFE